MQREPLIWISFAIGTLCVSWLLRGWIARGLDYLWMSRYTILLILLTAFIYCTPQFREVLYITYHDVLPEAYIGASSRFGLSDLLLKTLQRPASLSIISLALCFALFNPDVHHYWLTRYDNKTSPGRLAIPAAGVSTVFLSIVFYNVLVSGRLLSGPRADVLYDFANGIVLTAGTCILGAYIIVQALYYWKEVIDQSRPLKPTSPVVPKPNEATSRQQKAPAPPKWNWFDWLTMVTIGWIFVLFIIATFLGIVLVVAFCAIVGLALAIVGAALLIFSAPATYAGLSPEAWFKDIVLIVNLFIGGLLVLLTADVWIRRPSAQTRQGQASSLKNAAGWPISVAIILAIVTLSATGLNDNHALQSNATAPIKQSDRSIETAYRTWITKAYEGWTKPDNPLRDRPLPVYIVAAEGGGIYAAHHTALFLAISQDRNPDFARHIFAISSVSGGSLGASVFTSLLQEPRPDNVPNWMTQRTSDILKSNFLSALSFSALFNDLPARILPCLPRAIAFDSAAST